MVTDWRTPTSDRIVNDIARFTEHLVLIRRESGGPCFDMGQLRKSRRVITGCPRGGVRTKKQVDTKRYIHPDASAALEDLIKLSASRQKDKGV